jgi:DNA-binding XRE family transcriptional regulator
MTDGSLSIGDALRNVRKALGLRQIDFGERIFVARETASAWEQGETTLLAPRVYRCSVTRETKCVFSAGTVMERQVGPT